MPAKPLCQVIEFWRPGSNDTSFSGWSRLLTTLGIWISSSGWHSWSRMTRPAIQSVRVMMSRSMLCPARSCGPTLA